MAFVAEVVDRIGLDEFRTETPMGIVATEAPNSAFGHGMMGLLVDLGPDAPMAGKTDVRPEAFQILVPSLVNRMAIVTRDTLYLVSARVP